MRKGNPCPAPCLCRAVAAAGSWMTWSLRTVLKFDPLPGSGLLANHERESPSFPCGVNGYAGDKTRVTSRGHGAEARLHILDGVAGKRPPRAGGDQEPQRRPAVDRDGAIAEIGQDFLEPLPADLARCARVDRDIGPQRAAQPGVGMADCRAQVGFAGGFPGPGHPDRRCPAPGQRPLCRRNTRHHRQGGQSGQGARCRHARSSRFSRREARSCSSGPAFPDKRRGGSSGHDLLEGTSKNCL